MTVDNGGYIKIHRKMLKWEWFDNSITLHVFLYLLLNASWQETNWRGQVLQPGQLVTTVKKIGDECKLTRQQVRAAMQRLQNTAEITIKPTNKYSLITIEKWGMYQLADDESNQQTNQQATNKKPTKNQQKTIKKPSNRVSSLYEESKEGKEIKNIFRAPAREEVMAYCMERGNSIDVDAFMDFYESKGWMIGKNKMKDWRAAVRNWERHERPSKPQSSKGRLDWIDEL